MSPLFGSGLGGGAGKSPIVATGGTKTTSGLYTFHTFTSSGTFTVSSNPSAQDIYVLIIGGGGNGSTGGKGDQVGRGYGGHPGGAREAIVSAPTAGNYTVTVGGATGTSSFTNNANSITLSATGGDTGTNSGSNSGIATGYPGPKQKEVGSNSGNSNSGYPTYFNGTLVTYGGAGGDGAGSSYSGSQNANNGIYYGGNGGAGVNSSASGGSANGPGGAGGAGASGQFNNSGGGGGGSGGSGTVIIKYFTA